MILSHTHTHRTDRPINPNLLRRFPLPVPVESIVAVQRENVQGISPSSLPPRQPCNIPHKALLLAPAVAAANTLRGNVRIYAITLLYIYIYTRVNNRVNRSPPGLLAEAAIERHFSLIPPATRYRQRAASSTWLVGLAVIRNHDSNILIFNNPLSVFMCVCV